MATLKDGRVVPNHYSDATAMAAALGGIAPPGPQYPGAVPAPNPDPTMIPMGPAVAAHAPPVHHRVGAKKSKPKLSKKR